MLQPSLKVINSGDNSLQGSHFGHFATTYCDLDSAPPLPNGANQNSVGGDPFIFLPSLEIPSQRELCKLSP